MNIGLEPFFKIYKMITLRAERNQINLKLIN